MILIKKAYSDKYIDRGEFGGIVEELIKYNYSTFFYNLSKEISKTLDLEFTKECYSDIFFHHDEYPYKSKIEIELFVKNDVLLYVLKGEPEYKSIFVEQDQIEDSFLEFGAIGEKNSLDEEFEEFIKLFRSIVLKYENENYPDEQHEFEINQINQDINIDKDVLGIENLKFVKPSYGDNELSASILLSQKDIRELAVLISKGGKILEENLLRRTSDKEKCLNYLNNLLDKDIITEIKIIQCRESSRLLSEHIFDDGKSDQLLSSIKCFECGRKYSEELIKAGYKLTEFGAKLIQSNHWMTIFVSNELINQGIPKDSILWNIALGGDEIDLLIKLKNHLFVVELKDKEFGPGNAHALNFRRSKFNADKVIIITTEKVAETAKAIFEHIKKDFKGDNPNKVIPIYIEGLDNVTNLLAAMHEDLSLHEIFYKIKHIETMTGFNLIDLVDKKYGIGLGLFKHIDIEY
jgi:hypothetical protein